MHSKFLLVVGLCLCAAGCTHPAEQASVSAAELPVAAVAIAKQEPISTTYKVAGEFLPYQEVELHAKVAGYIRRITVDIGDRVRAGQVLAELEVPELAAQVQGAAANVRHSSDEITGAQNELTRAEANRDALHSAAVRLDTAAKQRPGLIAEQELDDARARDRSAEAQVQAARAALSAAQQQLDVSKAGAQQANAMHEYSRITAPFAGVVTWRYADPGALIQAGTSNSNSQPVVKLAETRILRLRVPVPESVGPNLHVGDVADVRVSATGERLKAKVARTTASFDPATRTMQVEFEVPNGDYKLTPGMFAEVTLPVASSPNALSVPVQAIQRNGSDTRVLVVNSEDRVQSRSVETGLEGPERIEIRSGIDAGDRVIVANAGSFQPQQRVRAKEVAIANGGQE